MSGWMSRRGFKRRRNEQNRDGWMDEWRKICHLVDQAKRSEERQQKERLRPAIWPRVDNLSWSSCPSCSRAKAITPCISMFTNQMWLTNGRAGRLMQSGRVCLLADYCLDCSLDARNACCLSAHRLVRVWEEARANNGLCLMLVLLTFCVGICVC